MAERRNSGKPRKSSKKSLGNMPAASDLTSEDVAKRRAALEEAVRRKVECEKRAHQIVERLLENNISNDFLLDCAKFISPSHYKDTVEERSIVMQCGYPICNKRLVNVPKQKYKISTKTNKVYDITERKCFCSDFCYRASKYYETQIPNTPLWTRDAESPPAIKLLKEGKSGHSGEEVKLMDRRVRPSEVEKPNAIKEDGDSSPSDGETNDAVPQQAFVTTVLSTTETHLEDSEQEKKNLQSSDKEKITRLTSTEQNVSEISERLSVSHINDHEGTLDSQAVDSKHCPEKITADKTGNVESKRASSMEGTGVTQRAVSKSGAEHLRRLLTKSKASHSAVRDNIPPVAVKGSMMEILTQTLNEWKSEETLKYLFGMNYVFEIPSHKEEVHVVHDQTEELDEDDISLDENKNMSSFDECLPFQNENDVHKPIPDYKKLSEETRSMELRVQEFFRGQYLLPEELEGEQTEGNKNYSEKVEAKWAPPLPLVDSRSQQQIRRRIVLEKLKKVLPAILVPLQITYSDVSKELHNLVNTFRFTNTNINRTTPEWSIIAIVLLSALLPTMPLHKDSQQSPVYTEFISRLLKELHFQSEDLEFLKKKFARKTLSSV
ncbi:putative RNA polymerase II subunit B1 CTD phosphatase RPAP2 [Hyperolius riggenbachi]|uniref:putative RNA polymerase II subunit B1 CTD phosphatase RPAP2 n=1 Tax=Hyperolius riggenbachi TaxID=752182 RepID=UPI0035A3693D